MADTIDRLRIWIEDVLATLGYLGVALLMALETIFPPIPSGLVLPMTGFLVAEGRMSFAGAVAAAVLGTLLGAVGLYVLGRWSSELVIRRLVRRYGRYLGLSEADLDRALRVFARYGTLAVLIAPFVPMLRSVILIPAGMQRMPLATLLLCTAVGAFVWSASLIYAGTLLGANWPIILGYLEQYQTITTALVVLLVVALAVRVWRAWFQRAPQQGEGNALKGVSEPQQEQQV